MYKFFINSQKIFYMFQKYWILKIHKKYYWEMKFWLKKLLIYNFWHFIPLLEFSLQTLSQKMRIYLHNSISISRFGPVVGENLRVITVLAEGILVRFLDRLQVALINNGHLFYLQTNIWSQAFFLNCAPKLLA